MSKEGEPNTALASVRQLSICLGIYFFFSFSPLLLETPHLCLPQAVAAHVHGSNELFVGRALHEVVVNCQ